MLQSERRPVFFLDSMKAHTPVFAILQLESNAAKMHSENLFESLVSTAYFNKIRALFS